MTDATLTEELEADYDRQVREVAVRLLELVTERTGEPMVDLLEALHQDSDVSRALAREALVHLLYTGSVVLTEDRHLVAS